MSNPEEVKDWLNGRCPQCQRLGEYNYIVRRMECRHCNISGVGFTPSWQPPDKVAKPKSQSDSIVVETYEDESDEGGTIRVVVATELPKLADEDVPELTFDSRWGLFHRHRLRDTNEKEKRWGRDHLRKLFDKNYGYDPVMDALLVAKRQSSKPVQPEPTYTPEDTQEYLDDVLSFLRDRDTKRKKPTI